MSGESHTGYSAPSIADGSLPSAASSDAPKVVTKAQKLKHAMPAINVTDDQVVMSSSEEEKAKITQERKNIPKHDRSKYGKRPGPPDASGDRSQQAEGAPMELAVRRSQPSSSSTQGNPFPSQTPSSSSGLDSQGHILLFPQRIVEEQVQAQKILDEDQS